MNREKFYIVLIILLVSWSSLLTHWHFKNTQELTNLKNKNYFSDKVYESYDGRLQKLENFKNCFNDEANRLNIEERKMYIGPVYSYTYEDINEMIEKCSNIYR